VVDVGTRRPVCTPHRRLDIKPLYESQKGRDSPDVTATRRVSFLDRLDLEPAGPDQTRGCRGTSRLPPQRQRVVRQHVGGPSPAQRHEQDSSGAADDISAADIIDALEGPVSITECSASDSHCDIEDVCNVGNTWQRINVAIRRALQEVSLVDLQRSSSPVPRFRFGGLPINIEEKG